MNLLLISEHGTKGDDEQCEDPGRQHYVCITNMSRLASSSVSKTGHKLHFCPHCNQQFFTVQALVNHSRSRCRELIADNGGAVAPQAAVQVKMPIERDEVCMFKNHKNAARRSVIVYADFEAINIKVRPDLHHHPGDKTRILTRH